MPGVLNISAVDADPTVMEALIDISSGIDRPESILTWKRSTKVVHLLESIAAGDVPPTRQGFDSLGRGVTSNMSAPAGELVLSVDDLGSFVGADRGKPGPPHL
jgi:hypothetical protein